MKVTYNGVEYRGLTAMLIAIPSLVFIGFVFIAIGVALTSPLWLLIILARMFQ